MYKNFTYYKNFIVVTLITDTLTSFHIIYRCHSAGIPINGYNLKTMSQPSQITEKGVEGLIPDLGTGSPTTSVLFDLPLQACTHFVMKTKF